MDNLNYADSDNKKSMLIAEDDDLIRRLYVDEFKKVGFEVDEFATGTDASNALQKKTYDVALLDILMPDANGLSILKQAKESSSHKEMKVIMLTNLGQESVIDEAFKLGADGYLIKSAYNPDQIIAEVKKVLMQPFNQVAGVSSAQKI